MRYSVTLITYPLIAPTTPYTKPPCVSHAFANPASTGTTPPPSPTDEYPSVPAWIFLPNEIHENLPDLVDGLRIQYMTGTDDFPKDATSWMNYHSVILIQNEGIKRMLAIYSGSMLIEWLITFWNTALSSLK